MGDRHDAEEGSPSRQLNFTNECGEATRETDDHDEAATSEDYDISEPDPESLAEGSTQTVPLSINATNHGVGSSSLLPSSSSLFPEGLVRGDARQRARVDIDAYSSAGWLPSAQSAQNSGPRRGQAARRLRDPSFPLRMDSLRSHEPEESMLLGLPEHTELRQQLSDDVCAISCRGCTTQISSLQLDYYQDCKLSSTIRK